MFMCCLVYLTYQCFLGEGVWGRVQVGGKSGLPVENKGNGEGGGEGGDRQRNRQVNAHGRVIPKCPFGIPRMNFLEFPRSAFPWHYNSLY